MPNYLFAYHGGKKPESQEAGAAMMDQWNTWLEGLGKASVDPGNPVGKSHTVSSTGVEHNGGPNPLSGFSVIAAKDIDAALEIAKSCPFLQMEGTIEVAEMMQM